MEKRLNFDALRAALQAQGLSASAVAERLGVSREAVSKWLNGESFPRPDKLVRLGALVNLRFGELVVKDEPEAPVVAFRRVRSARTTEAHVERAREMGRALRPVVPFLPFDRMIVPPTLKNPALDREYLRDAALHVRKDIGVGDNDPIEFRQLIGRFHDLQTVLVPVVWGEKKVHENAVHIYLPDSQTTWVYLNLDVNIHDFLFWMAHELGHTLTPALRNDSAEDFADAFAAALLFPQEVAARAYDSLAGRKKGAQINELKRWAADYRISPFTVYSQVQAYAQHAGLELLALEQEIHPATVNFNKEFEKVSRSLFGNAKPAASEYLRIIREVFESPLVDAIAAYLRASGHGSSAIQTILDCSAVDAKELHAEMI